MTTKTVISRRLACGPMRFLLLALLFIGPAAAQMPEPAMTVEIDDGREDGATSLMNDAVELQMIVEIDCGFFTPDFFSSYRLLFEYNTTANLNVTGPDMDAIGGGLCASGGAWQDTYDLLMHVDRSPTSEDPPLAELQIVVRMETDDPTAAPPAEDASTSMEWFVLTRAAEQAAKEPPVPQEQTTPGPAVSVLAVALGVAALSRRD